MSRIPPRTSTTGTHYRTTAQLAHVLQAHARQAVRTRMPIIDGSTAEGLLTDLTARTAVDQPDDTKQLLQNMTRTCSALARARGAPNWQAVRVRAIRQAGTWVQQAESLLDRRRKHELQEDARSWKRWCRAEFRT